MFLRRHLNQPSFSAGLFGQVTRALGPTSPQPFHSLSGCHLDSIGKTPIGQSFGLSLLGILGVNSSSTKVNWNISLPCAMCIRSFIHSGNPKELEAGLNARSTSFGSGNPKEYEAGLNSRSTSFGSGNPKELEAGLNSRNTSFGGEILDRNGSRFMDGFSLSQYNVEQNADIVHVKMLRNNTFVTVTDSKGNKKFGVSAGKLTDSGGKVSRYAAEASAEQVGRDIRGRGIKSVVVKVNGFTFFKKKKQAILGLREGYSHNRGDKNPIVYIEDTTRRPHNGCRLRKKRRV